MNITFMRIPILVRLCAVVALIHGLFDSMYIFGLNVGGDVPVANAQYVFFAAFVVSRIIASVGLWLLAPWGGVVLLFVLLSEISISIVAPALSNLGLIDIGIRIAELALLTFIYRQAWVTSSTIDPDEI